MASKYAAQYMERAKKEIKNFEAACRILNFDPGKESDYEPIVKAMVGIGQFGTIRLARRFPFVTDEEQFLMVADVGLHFYWMTLDFWQEMRRNQGASQIF